MTLCLFAQAESAGDSVLMQFLVENWPVLLPVALGFGAIYLLLPQARRKKPIWAGGLVAIAIVFGAMVLVRTDAQSMVAAVLRFMPAGIAIVGGVMMITAEQSGPRGPLFRGWWC